MQSTITEEKTQPHTSVSSADLDFAELFRHYYPRVYNYLRYRVDVPDDAEDLIGIVFEKAYTYRDRFDAAKGAFSTWLFRIAHNELANYYRSRERRSAWETGVDLPEDLMTPEPWPETEVIRQEAVAQLLQALAHLSDRDRAIISLKFAGRLGNQEIGHIMELKEKTVSVVLLRAMRRLQQQMREMSL